MSMQKLVELLRELDESPIQYRKFLTDDPKPDRVEEIEMVACEVLIKSDGHPNFKNHAILKERGWEVMKGESDDFGWLSGVILTKKGKIVYG